MADKKPDYQDWSRKPDLSSETPDSDEGHRIVVWLWIIGMIVFCFAIWGLAELSSFLQPGPHSNPFFGP